MSTFNFKEILESAEAENFVHPEGKKVPATIVDAVYSQSKAGNDMITIRAKVTGGPNAGKGRPIRGYLMMERSSGLNQVFNAGVKKATLQALDGRPNEDVWTVVASELAGKPVKIDIKNDTFNNQLQSKITWVNPADSVMGPQKTAAPSKPATPAPAGSAEELELERLRRELAEAKSQEPAAERSAAPDDLPF